MGGEEVDDLCLRPQCRRGDGEWRLLPSLEDVHELGHSSTTGDSIAARAQGRRRQSSPLGIVAEEGWEAKPDLALDLLL